MLWSRISFPPSPPTPLAHFGAMHLTYSRGGQLDKLRGPHFRRQFRQEVRHQSLSQPYGSNTCSLHDSTQPAPSVTNRRKYCFCGTPEIHKKIKYIRLIVGLLFLLSFISLRISFLYKIFQNAVHIRPHVHVNYLIVIFTGNFREPHP